MLPYFSFMRRIPLRMIVQAAAFLLVVGVTRITVAAGFSQATSMGTPRGFHVAALLSNGKVLIAGGYGQSYLNTAEVYDPATNTYSFVGSMSSVRHLHSATPLHNGKVLVTGGSVNGSEYFRTTDIFDPATNTFTPGPEMGFSRNAHTATLLADGRVLVTGGFNGLNTLSSAEIYDPTTNSFSPTASPMIQARQSHTATLLPDGRVFIAGGYAGSSALKTAEIYDPATGTFSQAASLVTNRFYHTSTLLPNGKVIVVGGSSDSAILSSAELYDPATNTFTTVGSMSSARYFHGASLLPSGKLLVTGGRNGNTYMTSAEVFDQGTNTFTSTPGMLYGRYVHTSILLPNGRVLISGGSNISGPLRSSELYDSAVGSFSTTTSLAESRGGHVSVSLPDGKTLVAGGNGNAGPTADIESYDPAQGFPNLPEASMSSPRAFFTGTLLPNGKVLLTGGNTGSSTTASAELYDPVAKTTTPLPPMASPRQKHTATLLADGKVLLAGGDDGTSGPVPSAELFDPAQNIFVSVGSLAVARHSHTATLLNDGRVLVAGGRNLATLNSSELFDPSTRSFQTGPLMVNSREEHAAILLPNGKVFMSGGQNWPTALSSTEIYDPASGFSMTNPLSTARQSHRAILLHNGSVLVVGGKNGGGSLNTSEIYDPALNTCSGSASMAYPRESFTANLLPDGKVLVAGGIDGSPLGSAEIYTPGTVVEAMRPAISFVSVPAGQPTRISLSGTKFTGLSEGSGGATNNGAVNVPLLQVQGIENGIEKFIGCDGATGWTDSSFLSGSLYGLPIGFYSARIITAATPSHSTVVRIGPIVDVAPASIDFPGTSVTRTSAPLSVTIGNKGTADLKIETLMTEGTDASMFSASPTGCGILGDNGNCTVYVTFHPSSDGQKAANLSVVTNDPDHPVSTIPLTGTGIIVTYPLTLISSGTGTGGVTLAPGGSCRGDCSFSYADGTTVNLMPEADQGSVFTSWTGCDSVSGTTCSVSMTQAKNVQSSFTRTYPLNVSFSGTGTGTVNLSTGTTCSGNCTEPVIDGASVTLTPAAGASSYFAGWTGCDSVTGSTCNVTANGARNVIAAFGSTYPLSVAVTGAGTGTVTMPQGGTCPGSCSETHNAGTQVSLTANPANGSYFAGWTGCDDVNGTTCSASMNGARSISATFALTPSLAVTFAGSGTGTVNLSSGGSCTGNCTKTYTPGTPVTLTPVAASGSFFTSWTGCDSVSGNLCTVTMTNSKNVSALFTAGYSLGVSITGNGNVTLAPTGGTCSGNCSVPYDSGSTVTLTPHPGANANFIGWTGCDSVSANICTVTMSSAKGVTAAFTSSFQLYLTVSGLGSGRFDFSTGGSCNGSCNSTFVSGTVVTITPQPSPGTVFDGWTGCDQVNGNLCTVTMNGGRDITASQNLAINISGRIYDSLQSALNDSSTGETVRLRAYEFAENVNMTKPVSVRIVGGYEKTFTTVSGPSSIRGSLTISAGTATIDNLIIL